jgi:hypothetical protein
MEVEPAMSSSFGSASASSPETPRKTWQMRGTGSDFLIVRRRDLSSGEVFEPLLPALLDRWMADPFNSRAVSEMYEAAFGHPPPGGGLHPSQEFVRQVKPRLEEAFRKCILVGIPRLRETSVAGSSGGGSGTGASAAKDRKDRNQTGGSGSGGAGQSGSSANKTGSEKKPEKTWIEYRLVNQQGDPVPGAKFRVKITDGSEREGVTDAEGSVHIPGIDPGTCEISFLDYDAKEWKKK